MNYAKINNRERSGLGCALAPLPLAFANKRDQQKYYRCFLLIIGM